MQPDQDDALQKPAETNNENISETGSKVTEETPDDIQAFYNVQVLSAEQTEDEITNNDGSVIETFDTAFHNEPGYIKDHSLAGSNRADYYEARDQGKSDSDEELEYLRKQQEK